MSTSGSINDLAWIKEMKTEEKKINEDITSAVTIIDNELVCFYAIKNVLQSHKNLNEDDIQYATNYICSFYSYSNELIILDKNNNEIFDDDKLIMFLVYSDQNGICKFALLFNDELDSIILDRNTIALKKILLGPKEMFVELYDNAFLSNEDRDFITRLLAREIFANKLYLKSLKKKIPNKTYDFDTLTTKCYGDVCIQDSKILLDDNIRSELSKYEKTSKTIYTVDIPENSSTIQVYCFDTLELIKAITDPIPINYKSGKIFSNYTLKLLNQRFHKEINMYLRYKQIKSLNLSF